MNRIMILLMSFPVVFALLLTGCVSQQKEVKKKTEPLKEIVWPPPPEKPRVKWVAQYRGSDDVEQGPDVLKFLGEQRIVRLRRPQGIVADRDGNIYVSDIATPPRVFVFDFKNNKFRVFGRKGIMKLKIPLGLAIDNDRRLLFVADNGHKAVIALDIDSDSIKFVIDSQRGGFKNPNSVAVDPQRKRIYVSDSKLHVVKAFSYDGNLLFTIGKGKRTTDDDGFNVPASVSVDREGNVYVADMFNRYIKIFDSNGQFVKKIGYGVGTGLGNFSKLVGVAVDSEGHIYGLDTDFCNFQIFDQDNNFLLFVGEPGTRVGKFLLPKRIYIDENDMIYVSDTFNHRIQVLQYLRDESSKNRSGQQ